MFGDSRRRPQVAGRLFRVQNGGRASVWTSTGHDRVCSHAERWFIPPDDDSPMHANKRRSGCGYGASMRFFFPCRETRFRCGTFTITHLPYEKKWDRKGGIRKKPSRLFTVRALISWSLCPELNWRPHPYQGCALPTELQRHSGANAFRVSDEEAFSLIRLLRQAFFPHFFPPGTGRVRCRAQRKRTPSPAAWRRIPFPADRGPRGGAFRCARQGGRRA